MTELAGSQRESMGLTSLGEMPMPALATMAHYTILIKDVFKSAGLRKPEIQLEGDAEEEEEND